MSSSDFSGEGMLFLPANILISWSIQGAFEAFVPRYLRPEIVVNHARVICQNRASEGL